MTERETDAEIAQTEVLPHLWVLDLDRTILDTDTFVAHFTRFLREYRAFDEGSIHSLETNVAASAGSYDVFSALVNSDAEQVDSHHLEQLIDDFVEWAQAHADDFYEPGAKELLDYLDTTGQPYVFMTKGGDVWQTIKFRALGLADKMRVVTDQTDKTAQLNETYDGSTFVIGEKIGLENGPEGGIRAKAYTIVDDKRTSMQLINDDPRMVGLARGVQVWPNDGRELLPEQRGPVPDGAVRVIGAAGVKQYVMDMQQQNQEL